ncbi:MAG: hypothetical protein FJZ00_13165 [Candidatus Sericytochromatia bacterium]|uniref:Uncharacterized protein n=1 Tax=Candidatus Tanganyikabacteria bacterium TaxID=2961651 RepID=A0A938BM90_9BACT|nr:hypothetical protein [Candidatus Tanganyikabacteria bacterium]
MAPVLSGCIVTTGLPTAPLSGRPSNGQPGSGATPDRSGTERAADDTPRRGPIYGGGVDVPVIEWIRDDPARAAVARDGKVIAKASGTARGTATGGNIVRSQVSDPTSIRPVDSA